MEYNAIHGGGAGKIVQALRALQSLKKLKLNLSLNGIEDGGADQLSVEL